MLVSDYDYSLPEDRIAKYPPEVRGTTRLLVLSRKTGEIVDSHYADLADFLNPGDVLILNDTRVMQSRIFTELPDGRERELVVLENHNGEINRVMYRGKLHVGDELTIKNLSQNTNNHSPDYENLSQNTNDHSLDSENLALTVTKLLGNGIAEISSPTPLEDLAEKYGTVPLPPYLHRDATESDKKRYQTVWAKRMGSAAAPTASLNMTPELLAKLKAKGVQICYLTLHVGLGTFLPIRSDKLEDHEMHSEWYQIPIDTISAIKNAKSSGCRVVALGTTVARTLEYYARTNKLEGEDDIFIYPGYEFQLVDALLTNFHAPKSTVLMLAAAFAGWDHLKIAYQHAIDTEYNFLSYGDSMFIC